MDSILNNPDIPSTAKVTYVCDGNKKEYEESYDYSINNILPIDLAELLIKKSIGKHTNPAKDITLRINGEVVWHAFDLGKESID